MRSITYLTVPAQNRPTRRPSFRPGAAFLRITGSLTDRPPRGHSHSPQSAAASSVRAPMLRLGMSHRMALKRLDNILQLCVSVEEIEPRIWRRIQAPGDVLSHRSKRVAAPGTAPYKEP